MTSSDAIALFQQAIFLALTLAGPMLLFGLIAGLMVSIFQAVTQVHEMTLTFIPKILAVVASLFIFLPWMVNRILDFSSTLLGGLATLK
jgi:flagellar biosynthesis protein FliQ